MVNFNFFSLFNGQKRKKSSDVDISTLEQLREKDLSHIRVSTLQVLACESEEWQKFVRSILGAGEYLGANDKKRLLNTDIKTLKQSGISYKQVCNSKEVIGKILDTKVLKRGVLEKIDISALRLLIKNRPELKIFIEDMLCGKNYYGKNGEKQALDKGLENIKGSGVTYSQIMNSRETIRYIIALDIISGLLKETSTLREKDGNTLHNKFLTLCSDVYQGGLEDVTGERKKMFEIIKYMKILGISRPTTEDIIVKATFGEELGQDLPHKIEEDLGVAL